MNEDSVASCSRALEQIREREGWWVGWTRVDGVDGVEMLKVWPQISIGNIQSLRFPHFQQSIYIYWFQIPSRTPKNRRLHNTHLRWGKDTNRKGVVFLLPKCCSWIFSIFGLFYGNNGISSRATTKTFRAGFDILPLRGTLPPRAVRFVEENAEHDKLLDEILVILFVFAKFAIYQI